MHRPTNLLYGEPLFIIVLHLDQAETQFKNWAEKNQISRYQLAGRRLFLYSNYDFDKFRMTWSAGLKQISVWDNWNRRLIYL